METVTPGKPDIHQRVALVVMAAIISLLCVGCTNRQKTNDDDNAHQIARPIVERFRTDCPDPAVSLVVYRRLDDEIDTFWKPKKGMQQLAALEKSVERMPDSCTKKSYLYWIPVFREQASDFLRIDKENAAADAASKGVPRP